MDKIIFYPAQLIGIGIVFIIVCLYIKNWVKSVISLGGKLPGWLEWLRTSIKALSRPDFLSAYQVLLLLPIWLESSAYRITIYFALAALFDALDGLIARLFPQTKTSAGEFIDSFADKILITGTVIKCWAMMGFSGLNKNLIVLMIGIDGARVILTFVQRYFNKRRLLLSWKIASNPWGKIKRNFQTACLIVYLLSPEYNGLLLSILLIPTIFCGLMSNIGHASPRSAWYQTLTSWIYKPVKKIYRSAQV